MKQLSAYQLRLIATKPRPPASESAAYQRWRMARRKLGFSTRPAGLTKDNTDYMRRYMREYRKRKAASAKTQKTSTKHVRTILHHHRDDGRHAQAASPQRRME